jgi:hypothetical protein
LVQDESISRSRKFLVQCPCGRLTVADSFAEMSSRYGHFPREGFFCWMLVAGEHEDARAVFLRMVARKGEAPE